MPGVGEIGAELVETALVFCPWLIEVPVLGRILLIFAPHGGNDVKALEEYAKIAELKKTDRETRRAHNARYVLKASDAMECVEETVFDKFLLLTMGKALVNVVVGRGGGNLPDLLSDRIYTCIESKVLRQNRPRKKKREVSYWARPAKGHGHGRNYKKER